MVVHVHAFPPPLLLIAPFDFDLHNHKLLYNDVPISTAGKTVLSVVGSPTLDYVCVISTPERNKGDILLFQYRRHNTCFLPRPKRVTLTFSLRALAFPSAPQHTAPSPPRPPCPTSRSGRYSPSPCGALLKRPVGRRVTNEESSFTEPFGLNFNEPTTQRGGRRIACDPVCFKEYVGSTK